MTPSSSPSCAIGDPAWAWRTRDRYGSQMKPKTAFNRRKLKFEVSFSMSRWFCHRYFCSEWYKWVNFAYFVVSIAFPFGNRSSVGFWCQFFSRHYPARLSWHQASGHNYLFPRILRRFSWHLLASASVFFVFFLCSVANAQNGAVVEQTFIISCDKWIP